MRRALLAMLIGTLAVVATPAEAACDGPGVTVRTLNSARIAFGTITIEMHENQDNDLCPAGVVQGPLDQHLLVKDGDAVLCDRTAGIDPSFDPFFFGAGIHVAVADSCGVEVSMASITNPPAPDPGTFGADPGARSVEGAASKTAVVEAEDEFFWWTDGNGDRHQRPIPAGTEGTVTRGARITVSD